jgi:CysZ protein
MKYIVIAFLGPVMAALSEITEEKLTGVKKSFSLKRWMFEALRGVRTAILYLFIELSLSLLLLLFFAVVGLFIPILLPLIAVIEIILAFLIGAFFYGAAALDYVWEREGVGALGSFLKAKSDPALAIGVGVPFAIWMMIPVINFTLAPIFAPALASVAAVLALKRDVIC